MIVTRQSQLATILTRCWNSTVDTTASPLRRISHLAYLVIVHLVIAINVNEDIGNTIHVGAHNCCSFVVDVASNIALDRAYFPVPTSKLTHPYR